MSKPPANMILCIPNSHRLRHSFLWIGILAVFSFGLLKTDNIQAARQTEIDADAYEVIVTISANPDPTKMGQPTSILVKVTAVDTNLVPTGVVEVIAGLKTACLFTLDSAGEGSCVLTFPSEEVVPLKAVYTGETPFLPGVSELLELEVQLPFPYEIVYQSDFETLVGDEWCLVDIATAPNGPAFLGEFNNTSNCLVLDNLPQHNWAQVSFDLYIIRSWDGNQTENFSTLLADRIFNSLPVAAGIGPDEWSLQVSGGERPRTLVHTTFSNWTILGFRQAFPGAFMLGDYPAQTGASATNTLGYIYDGFEMNATYHLTYTFPHSASSLELEFSAQGLQNSADESWGLDNLLVRVNNMPLHQIFLPFTSH